MASSPGPMRVAEFLSFSAGLVLGRKGAGHHAGGGAAARRGEGGARSVARPIGAAPGVGGGTKPFFPPRGANPDFTGLNFCHPRTSKSARGGTPPRRLQGQERP